MADRARDGCPAPEQPALNFDGTAAVDAPPTHGADPDTPAPSVVVRRSARRKRTVTAYREAGDIVVLIPQRMSKADEQSWVDDMVAKVLAREQKRRASVDDGHLARRAAELARRYLQPQLGYCPEPASVTWVTNQNHRWGSCTPATGTIRLSHRLQPMPPWVVDYVLLHELAHLAESRHSAWFRELVGGYPDADKAQGYLEGFQAGLTHQAGGYPVDGPSSEPPPDSSPGPVGESSASPDAADEFSSSTSAASKAASSSRRDSPLA